MHTGRISLFNDISGIGFIQSDEYPGALKFSYKEIQKTGYRIVCEGQRVLFDVINGARGPVVVNIIPADA